MIQQPINFPARTDQTSRPTQSICFFFNAQIHHLPHAMPLALELSHDPRFRIDIIAVGPTMLPWPAIWPPVMAAVG
ncbi:hypothetical protein ACFSUK_34755 [Sphingobium scionense]